jgi:hypothetical protein
MFYGTFIDANGDGIFRVLVPDAPIPALIPMWAKLPNA